MSAITIRPLTTYEEFKQVLSLEQVVWGFSDPYDMVPPVVFTRNCRARSSAINANA